MRKQKKVKMSRHKLELVLIEWIDSHSGNGWQPLDQLAEAAERVHCRSVGWLVSEGNGMTVLVSHISGEGIVPKLFS